MPDLINYVATSGEHVYFGMAEDPATEIARMRVANPHPIDLIAGWEVAPRARAKLLETLRRELRHKPRRGEWVEVPADWAVELLRIIATSLGGKRWHVRKRPRPIIDQPSVRNRSVLTPAGRFPSTQAAAEAHGISRQAAWERANRRSPGWRFEDDDSPPPVRARPGRPQKTTLTV